VENVRNLDLPRHIAIIMDGNGRWAKSQKLTRIVGHRRGVQAVRNTVTACREWNIEVLTLYAFSEENWKRPQTEVSALMALLRKFLVSERSLLIQNDIRLKAIGDLKKLPTQVQKVLNETMTLTKHHQSMTLVLALSYGGREELTRAIQTIAQDVLTKKLHPSDIHSETISSYLDTAEFPDPDLLIRTSGEYRTSNFLPWQSIYAELYITPTLWPDFTKEELFKALLAFSRRERRFGLISEQLFHFEPQSCPSIK